MTAVWRTSLVVTSAAVAAAALGGCQRSEAAPPPISAAMHVVNHRPVLDAQLVMLDGTRRAMRLLVDTASDGVVFSAAFAKRVGLKAGEKRRTDDGLFGETEVRAIRIREKALDISATEQVIALDVERDALSGVDGSIGAEVLRRYGRVTMNFPAERITLGEAATAPVLGALVPTTFDEGHVTARVTLGSTNYRLLVDSSAVTTHIRDRGPIRVTGTRQGVWGPVVLAPFEVVSDPEEAVARNRGILGGNLLERYTLRFDYERETLRISTT